MSAVLIACALGCAGYPGTSTGGIGSDPAAADPSANAKADGITDDVIAVTRRFEELNDEAVGAYEGTLEDGSPFSATVSRGGQRELVAVVNGNAVWNFELDLTYDLSSNAFVGFREDPCDDAGCVHVYFVSVRIYRDASQSVVLDYLMSAVQNEDLDVSGGPLSERAIGVPLRRPAPASDVVFAASVDFPARVRSEIIDLVRTCGHTARVTVANGRVEELDGERIYLVELSVDDGAFSRLSIAETAAGFEVVEFECPQAP